MGLVESIKTVAAFALPERSAMSAIWSSIHFAGDHVFASNPMGGACEPIDVDLQCSVSADRLLKVLKAVKGEPKFKQTKSGLSISCGDSRAQLATQPLSVASELPRAKGVKWKPTAGLVDAQRVAWSASADTTRIHLTGVHLGESGAETTNGHSFARVNGVNYCDLLGIDDVGILVPPQMIKGIGPEVWVAVEGNRLFVSTDKKGQAFRVCSLLEAKFPPADQIVASAQSLPAGLVDRAPFLDVLKRARISATDLLLNIHDNQIRVDTDTQKTETLFGFMESVNVEFEQEPYGCEMIGVDARWLIPGIEQTTSDQIRVRIGSALDPIVIEDGDYLTLVMPYRT